MSLSRDDARRLALAAQGLLGAPDRRAGVAGMLARVGAVQLDTISVLARSHELVAYARLGPVGRTKVEAAYWGGGCFEYWAHAASVLVMDDWPWFEFKRRHHRDRSVWNHGAPPAVYDEVLARLRAEGPLTATDLGGAKRGGPWWDWSAAKSAAEHLLARGDVACVERRGWRRVYDLAERAIPAELRSLQPGDEDCYCELVRRAGRHLGVGTVADLADYYRLKKTPTAKVVAVTGLVPVTVAGWRDPAWADPGLLGELGAGRLRGRHRTTLLSPFDSLVWDRARTERVFDFSHRLESYVPPPQRVHGYFAMPLLAGGRLAGRVDPKRQGRTLIARRVSLLKSSVDHMARALTEAASWVGCDNVVVDVVEPPELAGPLQAAIRRV